MSPHTQECFPILIKKLYHITSDAFYRVMSSVSSNKDSTLIKNLSLNREDPGQAFPWESPWLLEWTILWKKGFSSLFYWSFSASCTTYRRLLREIAEQCVWISIQRATHSTGDRGQSLLHLYLNIFAGWNSNRKSLVEGRLWTSGKDLNTPDRIRKR